MTDLTLFSSKTATAGQAVPTVFGDGVGRGSSKTATAAHNVATGVGDGTGHGSHETVATGHVVASEVGNGTGHGPVRAATEPAAPATVHTVSDGRRHGPVRAATESSIGSLAHAADLLDALIVALRAVNGDLLEDRLGLVGRCEARLASVKSDTVAELARRDGEAHAAEAVRDRLRQSRGHAKRDVKLAGQLADLPETAGALAEGTISPQHARMIAEAAEHTDVDEPELLAAAEQEPTDRFGHTLRKHVNTRSAGEDPAECRRRQRARREVSISRQSDGMYKLFGLFDPVAGARVEVALAAEARKLRRGEDPQNRATPSQRAADALELLVTRNRSGKAQNTTLLVIADYDTVAGQLDNAQLVDGTPLSADELVRLALEAKILPALFDVHGQPLWLGREQRDVSDAQRIALAARDRGCVGCGAGNSYCQPHHIWYWANGGPTDLNNLCLLCCDCHHNKVHTDRADIIRESGGKLGLRQRKQRSVAGNRSGRRDGDQHAESIGAVSRTPAPEREQTIRRAVSRTLRC